MVAVAELSNTHRVRTNWVRFVLGKLDRLVPSEAGAVRAAIPPNVTELLAKSAGVSLIPFDCHFYVAEALVKVLGYDRAVDIWTEAVREAADSAVLFRGLIVAVKTFTDDHSQIVAKAAHQAWRLVTTACGELEAAGEDGDWFGVAWVGIPDKYFVSEGLRAGWEGSIRGAFKALGDDVEMRSELRGAERRMVFWSRKL